MPLKVGALVPESRMFTGAGRAFLDGLRGGLEEDGASHELVVEPSGNSAGKDTVVDKCQRLLLSHDADVVAGVVGAGLTPHVHELFRGHQVPFVVSNLGADLLLAGPERNPYVFWNSLNLWRSCYALGYWAAENLGRTACVSVALHEAGYGVAQAFRLGFEEVGGGTVLATEVTHRDAADEDPAPQVSRLVEQAPDFIFGMYSGREGITFAHALVSLGLANSLPLVTTPLMTHGHWSSRMGSGPVGAKTAFSWDVEAESEAHARFRASTGSSERPQPDVFGLLGYETGRLIAGAYAALGEDRPRGARLRDAIDAVEITSPRGCLRVQPAWGDVSAGDHLFEVVASEDARGLRLRKLAPLEPPAEYERDHDAWRVAEFKSGWLNPYLIN